MDIKGFVLRFFAVTGLVLAFAVGLGVWSFFHLIGPAFHPQAASAPSPKEIVLTLDFTVPLAEQQQDFHFSLPALLDQQQQVPYHSVVTAIKYAKDDPRVKGIVARFGGERPSFVHVQEIAEVLRSFRESGKPTFAFAPSYGDFVSGGGIYALASQFENIWLQPVGTVGLTGLAMEAPFGKKALNNLGVQPDFLRREEYKSVMENMTNEAFSAPVKENMTAMLGSLADQLADEIAKGRKVEKQMAVKWMQDGPYTAQEAKKAGLVTVVGYDDEMIKKVDEKAGKDAEHLDALAYLNCAPYAEVPEAKADVAVIYATGVITDAPPRGPSRLAEEDVIDTQTIVDAFHTAQDDDAIKAVIFRVDSPGGSPVASETIRRALMLVREAKKPVIVSMGRVAASGGYWISMNGDKIVADAATITGSIGVVAGKFAVGGLMDKLGVGWDGIATSENALMMSPKSGFSDKGRERMNALLDDTYRAFTDNVSQARKLPKNKMSDIAKGRVYTGLQAKEAGLVDEIGGMDAAIRLTKEALGLDPAKDKIQLVQLPEPETPQTLIKKLFDELHFGGAMIADMFTVWQKVRSEVGPLLSVMQARGAVQARYDGSGF